MAHYESWGMDTTKPQPNPCEDADVQRAARDGCLHGDSPFFENRGDAALPSWALRAGGRIGRSIASTMLGGAMFAFLGLLIRRHVPGPAAVIGENLAWAGGGAWLFGCLWFVLHCRARRGWFGMLLRVNLSGVLAIWVLMQLTSQNASALMQPLANAITRYVPELVRLVNPAETIGQVFKLLVAGIFALQALRLSRFCRDAGRPE